MRVRPNVECKARLHLLDREESGKIGSARASKRQGPKGNYTWVLRHLSVEYGKTIVLKMYNSKLTRKGGQSNKELTRTRNRNPVNQKTAGTENGES